MKTKYSIILPCGRVLGPVTAQEARTSLPWMPSGSRIEPPFPPGNILALNFLDHLIFHHDKKTNPSRK